MIRFILTAVAIAFAALLTSGTNVEARGSRGGSSSRSMHSHRAHNHNVHNRHYHHRNYRGRDYRGWRSYCWFPRYGCYGCYCGAGQCWFYWCDSQDQYLPISSLGEYPPTTAGIAPVGSVAAPGVMPAGATAIPDSQ